MMKKTKHYTFRDYFKGLLRHRIALSESYIERTNGFGYVYKVNEEQLIYEVKSCTININRSMWPYHSIYSPEYIAKEKYKYV